MSLNYNFEQLNPREFEELVTDLFRKKLDTSVERFKDGKDLGVDSRFFDSSNGEGIIQCKHYIKSGVNKLISDLEKKELPKVQALQTNRYIIATTCPLSRINKQEIKQKLSPYILSETDIFGQEDLNDLLKEYPEIERAHYKLWLTSTSVLHSLLNNALLGRSREHFKNSILKNSALLVETDPYPKALELIQKNHTIIITGSPGVGKTTLANQISLHLCLNEEYEFYCIDENLTEAEEISLEGKKQLFYFDDFLGSNILEVLNPNNRDSKILRFIERIRNNSNQRFILTSRTHILNQKISLNERYNHANINKDRYELEITQLSDMDKAKILYNHIWHSNISEEYIDVIYFEKRYKKIIEHRNYNPRIIDFLTSNDRIKNIDSKKYWEYIQNTLNNPADVWKQVIERDIKEIHRYILLAVTLNKNQISEEHLYNFYHLLLENHPELYIQKSYRHTIETLLESLLQSQIDHNENRSYKLINPSLADYFLNKYLSEYEYLKKINLYLDRHHYAQYLSELAFDDQSKIYLLQNIKNPISKSLHIKLVNDKILQFYSRANDGHCDIDYELYYLSLHWNSINLNNISIHSYLSNLSEVIFTNLGSYEHCRLFTTIINLINQNIIDIKVKNQKLQSFIEHHLEADLEYSDYILLAKIINLYKKNQFSNIQRFKTNFLNYVFEENLVHQHAYDEDILSNIDSYEYYHSYMITDWIVESFLNEIPFEFSNDELEELEDSIDVDDLISKNNYGNSDNSDRINYFESSNLLNIDPISDLFQRN